MPEEATPTDKPQSPTPTEQLAQSLDSPRPDADTAGGAHEPNDASAQPAGNNNRIAELEAELGKMREDLANRDAQRDNDQARDRYITAKMADLPQGDMLTKLMPATTDTVQLATAEQGIRTMFRDFIAAEAKRGNLTLPNKGGDAAGTNNTAGQSPQAAAQEARQNQNPVQTLANAIDNGGLPRYSQGR